MRTLPLLPLFCFLILSTGTPIHAVDKGYMPVLTTAELVRLIPPDDLTRATITLQDGTTENGYVRQQGNQIRLQKRNRGDEHTLIERNAVTAIEFRSVSDGATRKAIAAMRTQDFQTALQLFNASETPIDKQAAYIRWQHALAKKG